MLFHIDKVQVTKMASLLQTWLSKLRKSSLQNLATRILYGRGKLLALIYEQKVIKNTIPQLNYMKYDNLA